MRENDKFMLRLPDGMRSRLKTEAAKNSRSLNAEIVQRLGYTLKVSDGQIEIARIVGDQPTYPEFDENYEFNGPPIDAEVIGDGGIGDELAKALSAASDRVIKQFVRKYGLMSGEQLIERDIPAPAKLQSGQTVSDWLDSPEGQAFIEGRDEERDADLAARQAAGENVAPMKKTRIVGPKRKPIPRRR